MSLIQLVYVSAATKPFSSIELRELLAKARKNNTSLCITGLLLYHKNSFFQILEGDSQEVNSLYRHIEQDSRHDRVLLLSKKDLKEERNFGEWSMGFIDIDHIASSLTGFKKLFEAKSSFLELHGDSKLVARLIDGFQEGQWRQSVEE